MFTKKVIIAIAVISAAAAAILAPAEWEAIKTACRSIYETMQ